MPLYNYEEYKQLLPIEKTWISLKHVKWRSRARPRTKRTMRNLGAVRGVL